MASSRVVFTFDERSLQTLRDMTDEGGFNSMAETVREALRVVHALQEQANMGYTEVIVRNPRTEQMRSLVIPLLTTRTSKTSV